MSANESAPRDPLNITPGIDPELAEFEAQLASLEPRHDRLDRDQLMFLAGRAWERNSRSKPRILQSRALFAAYGAGATAAAILLAFAMIERPGPESAHLASDVNPPPGFSSAATNASTFSGDHDVLRVGMTPTRVDEVFAVSWTREGKESQPLSLRTPHTLTSRSFDELL